MNKKIKILYIILVIILACKFVNAQNIADSSLPKIHIIAQPTENSVKLRWAPNTPGSWRYANEYGYILERYTFIRDEKLLPKAEKTMLISVPMKPWPKEQWRTLVAKSDAGAVAAQALYGESFEVTTPESDVAYMISKARELESRFSFALFAASQSVEVAEASALYYEDKTAKINEKYLYRVYSPIPAEIMVVDTGFIFTGIPEYAPLPRPFDLIADFGDKAVLLRWEREIFDNIFNQYIIERSDDGLQSFHPVTDLPFINASPGEQPETRYMYKVDTLPENNKEYHYRIRGVTPFGDVSPPSDTVSGTGIPALQFRPSIIQTNIRDNKSVELVWEFDMEGSDLIGGFVIERTDDPNIPYKQVNTKLVEATERYFLDDAPFTINYYRVKALGKAGGQSVSFPWLVQLEDSIPPAPPAGLSGKIDTAGIVTLQWEANTERDLDGYRVYRANFRSAEFSQVTRFHLKNPRFTDTINIKTLTEKIYYKVVAVDNRYNPSDFSEILELSRPDVLPPVSPVFNGAEANEKGVYLSWVNSSSADVVRHLLYRRVNGEEAWKLIGIFNIDDSIAQFKDTALTAKDYYDYTLIAVDDSKLESDPAKPVTIKRIDMGMRAPITSVDGRAERDEKYILLKWGYKETGVDKFVIYKSWEGQPLSMYRTLPGDVFSLTDKNIVMNTVYTYRIKAVFKNGDESALSREVVVNY